MVPQQSGAAAETEGTSSRQAFRKRLREKLGTAPTVNQTPDARSSPGTPGFLVIPGYRARRRQLFRLRSTPINPFTISETLVSRCHCRRPKSLADVLNVAGGLAEASSLKDAAITSRLPLAPPT